MMTVRRILQSFLTRAVIHAKQAEAKGARVTIISSDKDLMQLVSDQVSMLDTMKNKAIGIPQVIEKFGMGPDRVIEIQALAGDSVDNILTLKTDVELEVPLEDLAVTDPDIEVLFDFLEEMEFRTLTNRVRAALGEGETDGIRRDDSK